LGYINPDLERPTSLAPGITVPKLRAMKQSGEKIAMMTAYDFSFAQVMDAAGVDIVLVGDSLGMVVQGHGSTLPVSVADISYHTSAVARGVKKALVLADLPMLSYATLERALCASETMLRAGAQMVKLEGAGPMLEIISALSQRDVAVCAHLGLTPQSVHKLGGFKVQGQGAKASAQVLSDALAVQDAGADLLVLECVPADLAAEISATLAIPTVGIGAGPACDGQVLVVFDALGIGFGRRPRFVRNFMEDAVASNDVISGAALRNPSILDGVRAFVRAVKEQSFPGPEHVY
jgi:3-methyl-2-oxobutanoate hydroxymethyltransferase